ncbi:MAG: hypothetical protein KAQ89_06870 [Planctomycetes bacterium]|nr:hypothetical protein [Planctomycetota bacterium]
MSQTKVQSVVESVTGVTIGYMVAIFSQIAVFPIFGIQVSITDNFAIAAYFTVISLIRSYVVRRWFNGR